MDEKLFERRASDTLRQIERGLNDVDPSLEADLAADVLTIEFADGRQYIVNSHRAARQIWVSANLSAWHFSYDDATGRWVDTREGNELGTLLSKLVGERLGRAVQLALGTSG